MDSMDSTLATARPHPALSNTRMSKLEPNGPGVPRNPQVDAAVLAFAAAFSACL